MDKYLLPLKLSFLQLLIKGYLVLKKVKNIIKYESYKIIVQFCFKKRLYQFSQCL